VTSPRFLALDEVIALHADQIRRYGGGVGIRDVELLLSALGMPEASFDGQLLHERTTDQAAAYLFHLVRNHPFVDGNKRTGLIAAIAFLGLNGKALVADPDDVHDLVIGVASGAVGKTEVATFLARHVVARAKRGSRSRRGGRYGTTAPGKPRNGAR
jgi:death on curing protein